LRDRHGVRVVWPDEIVTVDCEVFAPCGLGGVIAAATVPDVRARVVAGAANNPLDGPEVAGALAAAGVLYVPDFLANSGGIIHAGAELLGLDDTAVDGLIERSIAQTRSVLRESAESTRLPLELAIALVEARLATAYPAVTSDRVHAA
jgi:leucine dehydrogenase